MQIPYFVWMNVTQHEGVYKWESEPAMFHRVRTEGQWRQVNKVRDRGRAPQVDGEGHSPCSPAPNSHLPRLLSWTFSTDSFPNYGPNCPSAPTGILRWAPSLPQSEWCVVLYMFRFWLL